MDKPLDELIRFLDDGEVRGEVRVEDRVETETTERGVDFAGQIGAGRQAERLAQGHANRGRDLHDADFFLVV